ncbi:CheR family methyltransferase [Cellulosilyticum ruminicola]|uniref:CheR family methyltransferase n=1 Tax=Cellulosilyticum ruminicola TaxID=425254 RepID=UPI0006CF6602|nr:CheR family methyltransferase [Cellulosilyticum ruminicola]
MINDKTGEGQKKLVNQITTNYTFFMREVQHFKFFKEVVLTFWKNKIQDGDLRIWCAACAAGEEAYALVIIIHETFALERSKWIQRCWLQTYLGALEKVKQGIYSKERLESLPDTWQRCYFKTVGNEGYRVCNASSL